MQGNDGDDTHTEELRFAFDFALPVGTPLIAVADGEVAAAIGGFRKGSRRGKEHRARANYVAVRHADGFISRYYHLCHGGTCVAVERAAAAGAAAAIVVNSAGESDDAMLTMGLPKARRGTGFALGIPALFVSHSAGQAVKAALARRKHEGVVTAAAPPQLVVGRSPHFVSRRARRDEDAAVGVDAAVVDAASLPAPAALKASASAGGGVKAPPVATTIGHLPAQLAVTSDFVPLTQPVRFLWAGRPEGYLAVPGERPPAAVMQLESFGAAAVEWRGASDPASATRELRPCVLQQGA